MATTALNPFDQLAIETNQHIATYLDSDLDLCRFRLVCISTRNAVDRDGGSFWRRRFTSLFESPSWPLSGKRLDDNEHFKRDYRKRREVLKNGTVFKIGVTGREKLCLEVLRDVLVDCFSDQRGNTPDPAYESKNLSHVLRFIDATNLLNIIFRPRPLRWEKYNIPNPLLHTIQCLLAPSLFSFNNHILNDHYGFPKSQRVVYGTAKERPAFIGCNGLDVNMEWVLHHINFWKYHMLRKEEVTLHAAFEALEQHERPRWWSEKLSQGVNKLGEHWKGSYAYVDRPEIENIRQGRGEDSPIEDILNGEQEKEAFQDLRLEFVSNDELPWPEAFERHLHSLTKPISRAKTRAQHRSGSPETMRNLKPMSFRFDGEGHDAYEAFCASGWLNPLPPQNGVPGWQRMTMMKYFMEDDGSYDEDGLWAYEGVVLPGGQIMLGRWWAPNEGTGDDMYSGPFILWCVSGPKSAKAEAVEDVVAAFNKQQGEETIKYETFRR